MLLCDHYSHPFLKFLLSSQTETQNPSTNSPPLPHPSETGNHHSAFGLSESDYSQFSSVQFSRSFVSDSLRPHELQHNRPPCPSPTPRVYRNPCPFWVGDATQPSHHLSSLLLLPSIFPSIRIFSNESALRIRWPKYWSFSSAVVLPMNNQDWSPLGRTVCISLQSKGLSRVFPYTTVQKHQFFCARLSL